LRETLRVQLNVLSDISGQDFTEYMNASETTGSPGGGGGGGRGGGR
jgi:hypothetical protein